MIDKLPGICNIPGIIRFTLVGLLHVFAVILVILALITNGLAWMFLLPGWASRYWWWSQRQLDYPIAAPWEDPYDNHKTRGSC